MALTVRDGTVTATITGPLEDLVRGAVEAALPGVRDVMLRDTAELLDYAQSEWPVRTGKSLAGLDLREELDVGRSSYSVRIVGDSHGDAPYTIFIKPVKYHGATTAWQRLVRGPVYSLRNEFMRTLGPTIVAGLHRSLGGK